MTKVLLPYAFFIVLGIFWRFTKPGGITAESLRKQITTLVIWLLLPLYVFFTTLSMPLNESALRIMLYVLVATSIGAFAAWFWLSKTNIQPRMKGAFLIAAAFGNVIFIGVPLSKAIFADWTMRVAVEYMLVANVILLFTLGAILAKNLAEPGNSKLGKAASAVFSGYKQWLKEPVIWAAILGLVLNIAKVALPAWSGSIEGMLTNMLIPLLLLAVGLSLNWNQAWNEQIVGTAPVVVVKLVLIPVLIWALVAMFGSAGLSTTRALMLDSMMPATLFGFVICERYKLDSGAYAMAYTVSTVLAMLTVPLMYKIIS